MSEMEEVGLFDGRNIHLVEWEDVRPILKAKSDDGEHWLALIHSSTPGLMVEIAARFYDDDKMADFTMVCVRWRGVRYNLLAMRKRHMLVNQYASLLRRFGLHLREREILRKPLLIFVPTELPPADVFALAELAFERSGQ